MATHQLIQRHQSRVPPGFRFHPTDEELVGYYLHKKVSARRIDLDVIREIDLYKMEPWDLQEKCRIGSAEQTEWYFFSHKDKKYPTGTRTNRATTAGFWKATGRDKTIHTKYSFVGMRKTLVFYKGRAPNGQKTDWIMHEYRLEDEQACNNNVNYNNDQDGWVVCRVFKKKINLKGQRNNESSPGYDVEEPALQPDFSFHGSNHQNSNASSYLMTTAPTGSQSFACKQEFARLEHFSSSPHHQPFNDPFSRLPQLESPKVSNCCTPPPFGIGTSNGASSSNNSNIIMRNSYGPGVGLGMEFEQQNKAGQEQTFMDEQMLTDWRAVDKLAAAQLSQEQQAMMKEPTTMRFCAESDDYAGVLMRLSKQDMEGCGEGELWNFASSRLDDSATL